MREEAKPSVVPGTGQRELVLALAVGLALYAWMWARFEFVCDDAFISFRYARRLVEGHGLRFNVGESPPVEGYSNLLWVLWLAPFEALGMDLRRVSTLTSGLCGALLIALFCRLVKRRLDPGAAPLMLAAAVLATLPPFVIWSSGGLETMAFSLAVFIAFERLALDPARPRSVAAGLAGMAAVLLRPDGALWLAVVLAAAVISAPREDTRRVLRSAICAGLLACAAFLGQLGFRLAYYHEWLPNTARAKAGFSAMKLERGLKYVASLVLELPFLVLLPLICLVWRPARGRLVLGALLVPAFAGGYAILVGGDFMAMGRFGVPAMPFVALLFASLACRLARARTPLLFATVSALVLASSLLAAFDAAAVPAGLRQRVHFRWNDPRARSEVQQWRGMRARAREWTRIGRALAPHVRPGESMVLPNLGAISYYTEVQALDPFGLISPEVARTERPERRTSPGHDKAVSTSFFYARRPDYLGAWIVPAQLPAEAGLPPDYPGSQLASISSVERFELPAGPEYRADEELRVLHVTWPEDSE